MDSKWNNSNVCLIKNGNFSSFQEIKQKYNLNNQDHFRYLQIRDYFDKDTKRNANLGLIRNIIGIYNSKKYKIISTMYSNLMERRGNNFIH